MSELEQEAILSLPGLSSQVRAGSDIVRPGDVTDRACLVVDGIIGRVGQLRDGGRQITAFHIAGDMCDLHSVVLPKAGWPLQALTMSMVLMVPHVELGQIARKYPAIAEAFWRDCAVDASILSQWTVSVGRRDARMRLAHLLCEMGIRMEQAGLGARCHYLLDITQAHFAEALGLTAVHANRMLQALRKDKLVASRNREITILDWNRLASTGQFDGGYLEVRRVQRSRGAAHPAGSPNHPSSI